MFWRRITSDDAGQALAELYTSHADAVFRYAYHLTGRREDAEDLVQVTFLEAQRVLSASGRLGDTASLAHDDSQAPGPESAPRQP